MNTHNTFLLLFVCFLIMCAAVLKVKEGENEDN